MININKLKKEIALNNLSIEELSEKIGIDKSTFYRWLELNGKKFTIEEVIKIANVLNLDRKKVDSIILILQPLIKISPLNWCLRGLFLFMGKICSK